MTPTTPPETPPPETPPAEMPPEPTDKFTNDELEKPTNAGGTQGPIAAKLNEQGIALMKQSKHGEATSKFREAVARIPESGYFFNLCASLYQEGKFSEALTACNAVEKNNPATALKAKNDKLTARIKWEAKRQAINVQP